MAIDCGDDVFFEGDDHVSVYNSSAWAERGFCNRCGTHIFHRIKQTGLHIMPVGLFEADDAFTFDHQVFIDDKPAMYRFANETEDMTGAEVFANYGGQK